MSRINHSSTVKAESKHVPYLNIWRPSAHYNGRHAQVHCLGTRTWSWSYLANAGRVAACCRAVRRGGQNKWRSREKQFWVLTCELLQPPMFDKALVQNTLSCSVTRLIHCLFPTWIMAPKGSKTVMKALKRPASLKKPASRDPLEDSCESKVINENCIVVRHKADSEKCCVQSSVSHWKCSNKIQKALQKCNVHPQVSLFSLSSHHQFP